MTSQPCAVPGFIFIAGITGRSGTNLLARLLLDHPSVVRPRGHWELPILEEADRFVEFYEAFTRRRTSDRNSISLEEFGAAFGKGFLDLLASHVAAPVDGQIVLHKNPTTIGLDRFPLLFPSGKLLLLTRDGHDCVNSIMAASGARTRNVLPQKYLFVKFVQEWSASARRILDYSGSALRVRYEDLVREPQCTLAQIAAFVGLEPHRSWLAAAGLHEVKGSTHYRAEGHEVAGPADWSPTPVSAGFQPIGRWRSTWTRDERLVFRLLAGAQSRALGYPA